MKEQRPTIRQYADVLAHEESKGTLPSYFARVLARLRLIEKLIPGWLEMDFGHALREAVEGWEVGDFAILIGRAVVYPNEQAEFMDPQQIWLFAQTGLGGKPKGEGRPPKIDRTQQVIIYDLWQQGGGVTQQDIAEIYGVSVRTIARIIQKIREEIEGRRI